ncbi:hypothetical protein HAX54_035190 [Datura stramonium]|uniref:Uncharacterized protein n=1 Tax=Datura stramonium TaxID=4076 RepID=A0ABS8SG00_DATST|nr:hypothetical protein [Datura stramonium]
MLVGLCSNSGSLISKGYLVQIWIAGASGTVLLAQDSLYDIDANKGALTSQQLQHYREESTKIQIPNDDMINRGFLQYEVAERCGIQCSKLVPVFSLDSPDSCVAVIELVTAAPDTEFGIKDFNEMKRGLEDVMELFGTHSVVFVMDVQLHEGAQLLPPKRNKRGRDGDTRHGVVLDINGDGFKMAYEAPLSKVKDLRIKYCSPPSPPDLDVGKQEDRGVQCPAPHLKRNIILVVRVTWLVCRNNCIYVSVKVQVQRVISVEKNRAEQEVPHNYVVPPVSASHMEEDPSNMELLAYHQLVFYDEKGREIDASGHDWATYPVVSRLNAPTVVVESIDPEQHVQPSELDSGIARNMEVISVQKSTAEETTHGAVCASQMEENECTADDFRVKLGVDNQLVFYDENGREIDASDHDHDHIEVGDISSSEAQGAYVEPPVSASNIYGCPAGAVEDFPLPNEDFGWHMCALGDFELPNGDFSCNAIDDLVLGFSLWD